MRLKYAFEEKKTAPSGEYKPAKGPNDDNLELRFQTNGIGKSK